VELFHKLYSEIKLALAYEKPEAQEEARKVVPLEDLKEKARVKLSASGSNEGAAANSSALFKDFLLLEVLEWFKADFFSWVDAPKCQICGGATEAAGDKLAPTPEEMANGALRIEA